MKAQIPTVTVSNIHFSAVWLGQESHRKIQLTALNLEKQLGEAWKTVANACERSKVVLEIYGASAPSNARPFRKGRFKRKVVFQPQIFQLTC